MHKLTKVEAERMMGVAAETIEKISVLAVLPTDLDSALVQDLRRSGHPKASQTLSDLFSVEKTQSDDVRPQVRRFLRVARSTDKGVAGPLQIIQACAAEPSVALCALQRTLEDLQEITFRRLSTTVERATLQKREVEEISSRLTKSQEDRSSLFDRLSSVKQRKEADLAELDKKIKALRGELAYLNQTTHSQTSSLAKESEERNQAARASFDAALSKLAEKEVKIVSESSESAAEHYGDAAGLRRRKKLSQKELKMVVAKYDAAINGKWEQTSTLRKQHEGELEELAELEDYFRKWDSERARIQAEEDVIAAKLAEEAAAQKVLDDAATSIQAQFRGIQGRKDYKKALKKAKKKKKKK
jgi:hypothetical protein